MGGYYYINFLKKNNNNKTNKKSSLSFRDHAFLRTEVASCRKDERIGGVCERK